MKTAKVPTKNHNLRFADMPGDYTALCQLYLPRPVHTDADYARAESYARIFAGFEHVMSADQSDYFELVCSTMEAWEKKNLPPLKATALDRLRFLLDQHGLTGADLSRILGASRDLGGMILRGERSITADHARTLGVHFHLSPAVFI